MNLLIRLLAALVLSSSFAGLAVANTTSDTERSVIRAKAIGTAKLPTKPIEIVITDSPRTVDNKYYYYNFGSVTVHYRESADFVIRNRGSGSLYFNNITISGSAYRAYSGCPYRLSPGSSCVTRVDFTPWYEGYHYGRLGFWFNDGGSIIIDLQGYGRNW